MKHPLPLSLLGWGHVGSAWGGRLGFRNPRVRLQPGSMCWGPLRSVLLSGPWPGPYACDSARVAAAGPGWWAAGGPWALPHQNHALHHSVLLHQQGRVPLRAIQVIAQQAMRSRARHCRERESAAPVAPMPRRCTGFPVFSAKLGSPSHEPQPPLTPAQGPLSLYDVP